MYFTLTEPEVAETPVIVEVPHASTRLDAESLATLVAPARALGRDADLYVDQLYVDAPQEGATLLVSHISRYVCDLNRAETEVDNRAAVGGTARNAPHGLVWRVTTENQPALLRPLARTELERRFREIYRPYHAALRAAVAAKQRRFGFAVLLCGHSMPSRGRGTSDDQVERADVVPGSRGRSTAAAMVIDLPEQKARARGWSVAHDNPYRGGFTTAHYGRPREGVHAVQIELARRLYMDEDSLAKKPGKFELVREYCRELVRAAGELDQR